MVFVNSKKYACESCIKGHRSSSCHHTDRPLFEIKKKGRPVTQCERCRELRKKKHMHVKCTCGDVMAGQGSSTMVESRDDSRPTPRQAGQRKIPSTPALPNGLRDLASQHVSPPSDEIHSKQRVDALLNPCNCKSVWRCHCSGRNGSPHKNTVSREQANEASDTSPAPNIKSCCGAVNVETLSSNSGPGISHRTKIPTLIASSHRLERRLTRMPYIHSSLSPTTFSAPQTDEEIELAFGLDLPPIKLPGIDGSDNDEPSTRILPPLKNVYPSTHDTTDANSLAVAALTRCGCGSTCACPGCKEHRGEDLARLSGEDCPDKCGSCIDHMGGIALPTPFSIIHAPPSTDASSSRNVPLGTGASMSTLDHFYAIAALLPPPPQSRAHGPGMLDPTNVTMYQQSSSNKQGLRKAAGLILVPPLNCCAGRCKCPGGMCGCGTECGGSCGRHGISMGKGEELEHESLDKDITAKENGNASTTTSCCAGRKNPGGTSKSRKSLRL